MLSLLSTFGSSPGSVHLHEGIILKFIQKRNLIFFEISAEVVMFNIVTLNTLKPVGRWR